MMGFSTCRPSVQRWLMYLLIATVTLVIYSPAIHHPTRADHWAFLADAGMTEGWWPLVSKLHSYNRVRQFAPGDPLLYRPVMFSLQCTELWLFKYNTTWWQLMGIMLHLCAVYWLFRLMYALHPGVASGLFAMLFAVLYMTQMAVIWHHINGYVLYIVLMLAALYHIMLHVQGGSATRWRLCAAAIILLAACFTYESGSPSSLVLATYALLLREKKSANAVAWPWTLLLALPAVIYPVMSYVDLACIHPVPGTDAGFIIHCFDVFRTATGVLLVPLAYMYGTLCPFAQVVEQGATAYFPVLRWNIDASFHPAAPWVVVVVVLLAACWCGRCTFLAWSHVRLVHRAMPAARRWSFPLLCCALTMVHVLVIVVGRANSRGLFAYLLETSMYNAYLIMPWMILALFGIAIAIGFDVVRAAFGPALCGASIALVLLITVMNAWYVYGVNVDVSAKLGSPDKLFVRGDTEGTRKRIMWNAWACEGMRAFYEDKPAESVMYFDRAAQYEPDNVNNFLMRGCAYEKLGHYDKALNQYARGVCLAPDDEDISNRYVTLHSYLEQCSTNAPHEPAN